VISMEALRRSALEERVASREADEAEDEDI
jgi:hypothetical protein